MLALEKSTSKEEGWEHLKTKGDLEIWRKTEADQPVNLVKVSNTEL